MAATDSQKRGKTVFYTALATLLYTFELLENKRVKLQGVEGNESKFSAKMPGRGQEEKRPASKEAGSSQLLTTLSFQNSTSSN